MLFIFSFFYFLIAVFVLMGLLYAPRKRGKVDGVSIIVVARNEENSLPDTLLSLKKLKTSFPKEIILVNDASTDRTLEIMHKFASDNSEVKVIDIKVKDSNLLGKKFGITKAVKEAKYEYIFTTDADCIVNENWLSSATPFFAENVGMLLGHVEYFENDFSDKMRNVEMLTGTIFTFSLASFSFSPYCRGGNMAFRKSCFLEVNGYENTPKIASGDDTFLLQKLQSISKIVPLYDENSFIKTSVEKGKKRRFEQTKRKYGKNFLMKPPHLILFFFGIFYHIYLVYALFIHGFDTTLTTLLIAKFFMEYLIFIIGVIKLKRRQYIFLYPLFIIFYPIKIIIFSFLGYLKGYRWKSDAKIR